MYALRYAYKGKSNIVGKERNILRYLPPPKPCIRHRHGMHGHRYPTLVEV